MRIYIFRGFQLCNQLEFSVVLLLGPVWGLTLFPAVSRQVICIKRDGLLLTDVPYLSSFYNCEVGSLVGDPRFYSDNWIVYFQVLGSQSYFRNNLLHFRVGLCAGDYLSLLGKHWNMVAGVPICYSGLLMSTFSHSVLLVSNLWQ